ncbi:hypothetical protein CPB86DRAFT_48207 [Serendipita vermifera]|nr:hypothetical protein CPB86DRAFT_48207 [Serendipita vermifera]
MTPTPKWISLSIYNLEIYLELWTWNDILVKDLKALIAAQAGGVLVDKQRLTIDTRHGRITLEDGHTLASYGIDHQSRVYVEAPVQEVFILVIISKQEHIELCIPNNSTVHDLKMRIASKTRILSHDAQRLKFHEVELENRRTLVSYGIRDASIIFMSAQPGERCLYNLFHPNQSLVHLQDPFEPICVIVVVTHKEAQQYQIGSPYIVNSLMGRIQTRQGIPSDRQMLFFRGEQLKEFDSLKENGISSGDFIHLEVNSGRLGEYRKKAKNWAHQRISAQVVAPAIQAVECLAR